jgi:hypothetical protein
MERALSGMRLLHPGYDGGGLPDCALFCGGSSDGKCEIDNEIDCAWQLIVDRLKESDQMERYEEILPVKDWRTGREGGPRKRVREDLKL